MAESHNLQKTKGKIESFRAREREDQLLADSKGLIHRPEDKPCPLFPTGDYILLFKAEAVGKVGSILLPGGVQKRTRPNRGKVVKVGPQVEGLILDVGDELVYHEYGEVVLTYENIEYIAVRERDVICRIGDTDAS